MNIKDKVHYEINTHKENIYSIINNLINDVYNELIKIEEKNSLYEKINQYELNTIKNNINLNNTVSVSHVNYHELFLKYVNLDNYQSININKIFNDIVKNNMTSQILPFVFFKLDKKTLLKYKDDDINVENAYLNIKINFQLKENYNIKLVKFQDENFIYIILFFDSLTYNDTFIFDNDSSNNIDEINYSTYFNNIIINNNILNIFRKNILDDYSIQLIKQKYEKQLNSIEKNTNLIEDLIKDMNNNIEINYEKNFDKMIIDFNNIIDNKLKKIKKDKSTLKNIYKYLFPPNFL